MNRVIIFEIFLFALVIVSVLSGFIGLERAGQVFLAIGIIDLILSITAWRGWLILRGNISNNAPLSTQDSGEVAHGEYSLDHVQPSTGFIVKIASIGIVAFGVGIVLLLLYS